jgi:hypothetical protein
VATKLDIFTKKAIEDKAIAKEKLTGNSIINS